MHPWKIVELPSSEDKLTSLASWVRLFEHAEIARGARETLGPTPKEQSRINQVDSALPTTTFLCLLSRPSGTVPSRTTTDIEPESSFLEPLFVHVMQPPASETRYHYDTQRTLSHRPEVDMNSIAPHSMEISES